MNVNTEHRRLSLPYATSVQLKTIKMEYTCISATRDQVWVELCNHTVGRSAVRYVGRDRKETYLCPEQICTHESPEFSSIR